MDNFFGKAVLVYMREKHPDVHQYGGHKDLFYAMRRAMLPCRKIAIEFDDGVERNAWSATAAELDTFADYLRKRVRKKAEPKLTLSPTSQPTKDGRYWGASVLVYMKEHHPDVYSYPHFSDLFSRLKGWGLSYKKIPVIFPNGQRFWVLSAMATELDAFAVVWRNRQRGGKPVVQEVVEKKKPTAEQQIVISPKTQKKSSSRKWVSLDEMIAHFAGTGECRRVPLGVVSLKEEE